ncbi:MAG: SRPBCC family protein [Chloroflexi bacterium]|nr:SRPBCC family protein [Chloroflexota bacterium]
MSRITDHADVDVPVGVAYNQWTRFESLPEFMEGVERVVQLDDRTLDWTARIAGRIKHWRAEVVEQEPDRVVAWRSVEGARNDVRVTLEPIDPRSCRVSLELVVEPEGALEATGDALGFVSRRVKGDLERFADLVESRGQATGAWRGRVGDRRVR